MTHDEAQQVNAAALRWAEAEFAWGLATTATPSAHRSDRELEHRRARDAAMGDFHDLLRRLQVAP